MISRRAFVGTGVAAVALGAGAAVRTHRVDDFARTLGIKPRPQPAPSDTVLIARVAHQQDTLLAAVEATASRHPALALKAFAAIGQAHINAVGGSGGVPAVPAVDTAPGRAVVALSKSYRAASTARAKDARAAVSPDLARVLASMSAGLAQCAQAMSGLK